MNVTTLRGRNGQPINIDQLYVGGVDIGSLLAQLNGTDMTTSSTIVTLTEKYTANEAGIGYAIGHILRRTELIDTIISPPTSDVFWYNFSTGGILTVPPDMSTLILQSQSGLTDTELRAAPVMIKLDPTSPDLVRLGSLTDPLCAPDGSGSTTIIAALKRLVSNSSSVTSRLPAALGPATAAGSIPVVINSDVWESAGYTLDAATGALVQERQSNGTSVRTRSWATTTDGTGNPVQTPGTWVYS